MFLIQKNNNLGQSVFTQQRNMADVVNAGSELKTKLTTLFVSCIWQLVIVNMDGGIVNLELLVVHWRLVIYVVLKYVQMILWMLSGHGHGRHIWQSWILTWSCCRRYCRRRWLDVNAGIWPNSLTNHDT